MGNPYLGEIRIFAGNFAPVGWLTCDGQLLAISDYDTLFNLIGTTYGGDGQNTFGLPDLRGRVPVHQGTLSGGASYTLGQRAGTEGVTLTTAQLPAHTHGLGATSQPATTGSPAGGVLAQSSGVQVYREANPATALSTQAVTATGGSQPHDNRQPYLAVTFIISTHGTYPSQT